METFIKPLIGGEYPPDLLEKERDFAAVVYLLMSIRKRTSPITEMVSHDIAIEFLSHGEKDPEYPEIITYKILDEPPGYNDIMINDLLARAARIIRSLQNDMWIELAGLLENH
jgi:hypothetical protein